MSIKEVESLLQQGTIEQIIQNMEKEQADDFLKTVYETVRQNEYFVGGSVHYNYMGFDSDKREIHGQSLIISDEKGELIMDSGHEDRLSFVKAQNLLREKLAEEKTESKTR